MALTPRQLILYTFFCELYAPSTIGPKASGSRATDRASDEGWAAPPTFKNVPCFYKSAEEATQPQVAGLTGEQNLFVFYVFLFDAAQKVENGWAIKFTTPGHPDDGEWFYVQNKPRTTVSQGNRRANQNAVLAARGPSPLLTS